MNTCDGCGNDRPTTGAIIKGKYGQFCRECRSNAHRPQSTGFAQWSRDRDREDNAKDLIQPWDRNGKPNRDFIREYPEQAQDMFTKEELENHG